MRSIFIAAAIFSQIERTSSFFASNKLIDHFPCSDLSTTQHTGFPRSKTLRHSFPQNHESTHRLQNQKKNEACTCLFLSNMSDDDLIKKANQLRKEAIDLESQLAESRKKRSNNNKGEKSREGIDEIKSLFLMRKEYKTLNDSCWMLTYRFSKNPQNSEKGKNEKKINDNVYNMNENSNYYYTGKLCLRFRADGYTEMISLSNNENGDFLGNKIIFDKVWGWDEETSNEDNLKYLLFSADITLLDPPTLENENMRNVGKSNERFYFQARIDTNRQNLLELTDGTVTVKREINRSNGDKLFWGIFDGSGILAQFYNVGYFSCKPIRGDLD